MKFFYQPTTVLSPETGESSVTLRPEIPVHIHGATASGHYVALVDTGADCTILPKRIADDLGIRFVKGLGPELTAFGGHKLDVYFGDVEMELTEEQTSIRWPARVHFFDFASAEQEALVMGHAGFLDFFTATFDGAIGMLTLVPNGELPATK